MSEILSGMVVWAQQQDKAKAMIAFTNKTNTAPYKVLEKNNFIDIGETETLFNWILTMKSH